MTSTGTGIGGNLGGPQVPMQRDLETTAWTEYAKASLGIVPDSIEKAFSEINPRYSSGYLGGFGYKSTAENPLLDHPLETMRLSQSFNQATDETWQLTYQQLVNQLPSDLLSRFVNDQNKPFESRNLSFIGLDNLLLTTAKILTKTENLAQPMQANSLEEARTMLNTLLPIAALKGAIQNGNEVVQSAQDFLAGQGANYTYFDGFNSLLNQMQSPLNLMAAVNNSLSTANNGQLSPQAITYAGKASQQLATLSSQLQNISLGTDLQLMLSTINTLQTVSTALALQNTATAPLFLALSLASLGIYTSESSVGGLIGPSFQAIIDNLNSGLIGSIIPPNNRAGNELLSLMLPVSLATFTSLASLAINSGLGIFPERNPQDIAAAQSFAFSSALQLAVSSGVLETFYNEFIAVSGGNSEAQILGSSVLAQTTNFLMMLSASTANRYPLTNLVENGSNYLSQGLASADEIEKSAESEQTTAAAIAIKLSSLALESQDYEGFLSAFNNFLEEFGTSQTALQEDIAQTNLSAETTVNLANMGNTDQRLNGLINVV